MIAKKKGPKQGKSTQVTGEKTKYMTSKTGKGATQFDQ